MKELLPKLRLTRGKDILVLQLCILQNLVKYDSKSSGTNEWRQRKTSLALWKERLRKLETSANIPLPRMSERNVQIDGQICFGGATISLVFLL